MKQTVHMTGSEFEYRLLQRVRLILRGFVIFN